MNCLLCNAMLDLEINKEHNEIFHDYECKKCNRFAYSMVDNEYRYLSYKTPKASILVFYKDFMGPDLTELYKYEEEIAIKINKAIFPKKLTINDIEETMNKIIKYKNFQ